MSTVLNTNAPLTIDRDGDTPMPEQIEATKPHTPGPWTVQGDGYDTATYVMGRDILVRGGTEDRIIAVCHSYGPVDRISRLANAAFIVKAANSHDELVAALRDCIDRVTAAFPDAETYEPIKKARAVLAKVEAA